MNTEMTDVEALMLIVITFALFVGSILMLHNIVTWCINWKFNIKKYIIAYYHRRWKYGWVNDDWSRVKKWNNLSEQEKNDVDLIGKGMIV